MNFLLGLIIFFPYVFPAIFSVMLDHIGVRLPFWKWVVAMILGVALIHSSIFFMWRLGPSTPVGTSLDDWLIAMEKIDLILIVLLVGTYFYARNRVNFKRL